MPKPSTQPVTVRIASGKVAALDELAAATDRPRAWHVEQALESYLELQQWQLGHIAQGLTELEAGQGIPQAEIEAELATWGTETPAKPKA